MGGEGGPRGVVHHGPQVAACTAVGGPPLGGPGLGVDVARGEGHTLPEVVVAGRLLSSAPSDQTGSDHDDGDDEQYPEHHA